MRTKKNQTVKVDVAKIYEMGAALDRAENTLDAIHTLLNAVNLIQEHLEAEGSSITIWELQQMAHQELGNARDALSMPNNYVTGLVRDDWFPPVDTSMYEQVEQS